MNLHQQISSLAARATKGPFQVYGEPEVNLPAGLFAGTPMQSGFAPVEPLQGADLDLVCLLLNSIPEILQAFEATQWRPIETAPRGTHVLVMCPRRGVGEAILGDAGWQFGTFNGQIWDCFPTHWMPIPGGEGA